MMVSSSSVSTNSTKPFSTSSDQPNGCSSSPIWSCRTWRFFSNGRWFSTMNSGRHTRPASVQIRSSFSRMSRTMEISHVTSPQRRSLRRALVSWSGSWCTPTQFPLTNTLVAETTISVLISSRFTVFQSSRNSRMGVASEPTEMYAMRARFLMRPHVWPSGVSAGQRYPQWVLCNWRGLACLVERSMGVLRRRRWDKVEANVRRFSTWDTPDLAAWPRRVSQLPVASEYWSPSVIIFSRTAARTSGS
mmetsp:Transcript_4817/g.13484  ORF Transcript_4817/g.13484 Transcript_4817/m.13484 type:complete len:247 (-) Transcript_4817:1366-2106(-)